MEDLEAMQKPEEYFKKNPSLYLPAIENANWVVGET